MAIKQDNGDKELDSQKKSSNAALTVRLIAVVVCVRISGPELAFL